VVKIQRTKSTRGRKAGSGNVRLEPVFRKEIDIEKLGRAIISMAVHAVNAGTEIKQNEENPALPS